MANLETQILAGVEATVRPFAGRFLGGCDRVWVREEEGNVLVGAVSCNSQVGGWPDLL